MADSRISDIACDRIWRNMRLVTLREDKQGLGLIESGAIASFKGRIVYAGAEVDMPAALTYTADITNCEGRMVTPGLIDCHTHLVHAGNRSHEFELRLKGASYEEIARANGGIASSVQSLRAASEVELVRQSLPRLDALIAEGVTTIEIKSGYGLDRVNELKSLRAAKRLGQERTVTVKTTFLGAHALPPEANGDASTYIDTIINEILPAIVKEHLADAVDGFCEGIAFSPEQMARVFDAAHHYGLPIKLHADQLSNLHGAALAARYGALSADHLEYTDEDGVIAMAKAGTVAVILPGAFYFIRETQKPPIELFRKHGVRMAVATDCNPGTSPLTSLLLPMNMCAT